MSHIAVFIAEMKKKNQSVDYYKERRNASTPDADIALGKLGECYASWLLQKNGFPLITPDFTVRTGTDKGWDCDLPFSKIDRRLPNCHVKTCNQKTCDFLKGKSDSEFSWTFQYNNNSGKGGRDKLFYRPDSPDVVLFMYVPTIQSLEFRLVASAPWIKVQNILTEPIAAKYKGLKKCIDSNNLIRS